MTSARLACTVRGCGEPLVPEGSTLRCPRGHAFDRAREGYWSLLQPQDRRSPVAGDRPEAVEARRRWIDRGFVAGLSRALREMVRVLDSRGRLSVAVWASLDDTPGYAAAVRLLDRMFGREAGDALRAPYNLGDPAVVRRLVRDSGIGEARIVHVEGAPGVYGGRDVTILVVDFGRR